MILFETWETVKNTLLDFFNFKSLRYITIIFTGENCFESFILPPNIFISLCLKFSGAANAAKVMGPAKGPRPTSSTPMMNLTISEYYTLKLQAKSYKLVL